MNKSKISETFVNIEQIEIAQKKLKRVKYPISPVSIAQPIKQKIKNFSKKIRQSLLEQKTWKINSYRRVRGDGNCFFRAFAFTYIVSQKTCSFDRLFPELQYIKLTSCKKETIPKDFQPYYDESLLKAVLRHVWEKDHRFFLGLTQNKNYQRSLSRLLVQNPYLDFIIILYFRALCNLEFKNNKQQLKSFLNGNQQEQILSYGEESQSIIINSCSIHFKMNIRIFEIRKEQVITYDYTDRRNDTEMSLLYYDNHYDLLEDNRDVEDEKMDRKMEEEVYNQVCQQTVEGTCFECDKKTDVFSDNGLCQECYQKSVKNLQSFKKDKFVRAECGQCHSIKDNVSQQMGICNSCVTDMKHGFSSSSRVRTDQTTRKIKCRDCRIYQNPDDMVDDICVSCIQEKFKQAEKQKQRNKLYTGIIKKNSECLNCRILTNGNQLYNNQCYGCINKLHKKASLKSSNLSENYPQYEGKVSEIKNSGVKKSILNNDDFTKKGWQKIQQKKQIYCKECNTPFLPKEQRNKELLFICDICQSSKSNITYKNQKSAVKQWKKCSGCGGNNDLDRDNLCYKCALNDPKKKTVHCILCKNTINKINQNGVCTNCQGKPTKSNFYSSSSRLK